MINQKKINIGNVEVLITQFDILTAHSIRAKLVNFVKKQIQNENVDLKSFLNLFLSLVYELPESIILELFSECQVSDIGGLDKENLKKSFPNNNDAILQLALEVIEFNGFFSLNTISTLVQKFPILKPLEKAVKEALSKIK